MAVDPKSVRQHSQEIAMAMGVEIASSLPLIEPISRPKSKEAITDRLLCLHVVAACSYGFDYDKGFEWLGREQLANSLTERESEFLKKGIGEKTTFQFSIEGMLALSWVLGLARELDFSAECSRDFFFLMPNLKQAQSSSALRDQIRLRSTEEIFAAVDLAYCLHWAVRNAAIGKQVIDSLAKSYVIAERRRALDWVSSDQAWDDVALDT
jgi:hypothetical protein